MYELPVYLNYCNELIYIYIFHVRQMYNTQPVQNIEFCPVVIYIIVILVFFDLECRN